MRCCSIGTRSQRITNRTSLQSGSLQYTDVSGYPDGMPRRAETTPSIRRQRQAKRTRGGAVARLRMLTREERQLEAKRVAAVSQARADGESWAVIADALGMTKQSAWEYFNDRLRVELSHQLTDAGLSEAGAMRLAVSETKRSRRARRR